MATPTTDKRAALCQTLGLPPDADNDTITKAVAAVLGDAGADPKAPLPPERVASLARYHGISEREVRMCHEIKCSVATYAALKRSRAVTP